MRRTSLPTALAAATLTTAALFTAGCGQIHAAGTTDSAPGARLDTTNRSSSTPAELRGVPLDAALVTPKTGWVLTEDALLLTRDGGSSFTIATTGLPAGGARSAAFVDARHGWVAVQTDRRTVSVARTGDGGATWSTSRASAAEDINGVRVAFGDAEHGAVLAKTSTGPAFSRARLFTTGDGGRSWQDRAAPAAGEIAVEPSGRIWLAGGATADRLYASSDAARHWTRATLPYASNLSATIGNGIAVDVPRNGVLPVTVVRAGHPRVDLLGSSDGGRTWTARTRLAVGGSTTPGVRMPVAIAGHEALVADPSGKATAGAVLPAGGSAVTATAGSRIRASGLPNGVTGIAFARTKAGSSSDAKAGSTADAKAGWAISSSGHCRGFKSDCSMTYAVSATTDGGATWHRLLSYVQKIG